MVAGPTATAREAEADDGRARGIVESANGHISVPAYRGVS
jgi:hypothetical protein